MALHSVSDSLLIDWDRWSSQSEKYKPGDCDKKWKSFKSSGVSIGSIAHMAKQDGWRSPFERSNSPRNAYTGDRNSPSTRRGGSGGGGTPLISSVSLRDRVLEILNRNHSASEQKSAFLELAGVTNRTLREIEQLAEAIEADLSSQSAQSDNTKETNKLVEYREQTLDLRRVFPAPLANYLLTKADSDRLDPAFVYQYLWNAIGLSLGAHIGIRGKEGTAGNDWLEFPIFYNVVIAPPSSGKSQTMRAVLGPIKEKQNAERAEYKKAQKHLEGLKEKWKNKSPEEKERLKDSDQNPDVYAEQMPQPPKVRLIEAGSPEGAFKRMSELPPMSGCSLAFDELIRILSLDQYKNQGGDSRQVLMEAWAYPFSTAFVRSDDDDTPSLNKICISITGGIQPSKAKKLLSDPDDGDGLLSRFLITQTKTPENFAIWSDTKVDINQALSELYKFLEGLHYDLRQKVYGDEHFQSVVDGKQVILQFDAAAEKRWRQWWEHVRHEQRRNEHENPALSGYLGKILSQTLRIALGLHCVELAYEAKADPLTVGLETLEKAIYAAKFHIGQFRLLQAHNDTDSLPGHLERIHQFAKRKGKPVSASQVQMTVFRRSERKPTLAQIREYFKQLADTGAVTLVGEGKDLKIQVVIIMTSYDKKYDNEQTLRSTTNQGLQELVDKNYDNYDNFDNRVSAPVEPESDEYQSDGVDSESSTNGICHNCHNFADDAPSTPDLELNAGVDDLSENLSDRVINYDNPYDGYDITADASPDAKTAVIKYDGSEDTLPAQGNGGVKADDTETADCEPNGTVQSTVPSGTGFGAITPPEPQQSLTPAAVNTASVDFKIGDTVAHSDPYTVAYTFYGVVEEVVGDEILVRWTERQGKANEYEIYNTSELRRIESQVP